MREDGIGKQVAAMLKSHTGQTDTLVTKAIKQARKKQLKADKTEVPPWDG